MEVYYNQKNVTVRNAISNFFQDLFDKKKTFTNLKLIIIHGSDYLIDDELMDVVVAFLPKNHPYIQHVVYGQNCKKVVVI
mgnify:CR=1 FL=1